MRGELALVALMLFSAAPLALAEDCTAPCIGYAVTGELQNEWLFSAHPSSLASNDLEPTLDVTLALSPFENFRVISATTTESVLDKEPGGNRAFKDIGTYQEQLYGEVELGPATIQAGKFNPLFGLATNELDGIAATDLVGAYDNMERWGAQAAVTFEAMDLSHSLTASAFTTDRTALSDSLFTRCGRLNLADGGAGNVDGIGSFAAVYDGCKGGETANCFDEGQLGYRLAFRYQKAGQATVEQAEEEIVPQDEFAYLGAMTVRFEIDDETTLRLLGEFAYVRNLDGTPDDAVIGTGSLALEQGPVTYMATYSRQTNLIAGEPDTKEHLFDLTAVYDFGEDTSLAGETWKLGAGYSYARNDDGETGNTFNVLLSVDLEGDFGL